MAGGEIVMFIVLFLKLIEGHYPLLSALIDGHVLK
jgi:hypothetical protein